MSLQLFIIDLTKENLSKQRLKEIWDHHNLQSKSPLIDPFTKALYAQFEKHSNGDDSFTFEPANVTRMYNNFRNKAILKLVERVEPMIEEVTIGGKSMKWDPPTGIVFEERESATGSILVATKVCVNNKLYDLQLKHLNICVSKGWKFETNNDLYSSPFRYKKN